jgi:hypothetical protein
MLDEKFVCSDCLPEDEYLQDLVKQLAVTKRCSYCSCRSRRNAVAVDEVVDAINTFISADWDDAGEYWMDGDYVTTTYSVFDILYELEFGESEELLNDLANAIGDGLWCRRDGGFRLEPHEALNWSWERFSQFVKHNGRYFVLNIKFVRSWNEEGVTPDQFLKSLANCVNECGLIKSYSNCNFFRVRLSAKQKFTKASELGPPSPDQAKQSNRMSPVGVPAFYGALDVKTAVIETYNPQKKSRQIATVAQFRSRRSLRLLDLTNIPDAPSALRIDQFDLRHNLLFLSKFARDVAKPIDHDGSSEHIDYVPTQVITEYFRLIYGRGRSGKVDGILYDSARNAGGVCCVLFFGQDDCVDNFVKKKAGKALQLESHQTQVLSLPSQMP